MKNIYIVLFLLSVLLSAISQILLKASADKQYESKVREYLNFKVIVAYMIFCGSSILTILAYRGVPLSVGAVLEATGYLWVAVLGRIVLKESINRRKILGLAIIIFGTIVSVS